jgi:hypothetical protein
MRIQIVTATILLLTLVLLSSGCSILKKLTGNDYSDLESKKEELANFQPKDIVPAFSGDKKPPIKGKVVIVKKMGSGPAFLDRFSNGKFSEKPAGSDMVDLLIYPPEVYAKTPEEISTLIKIECDQKKGSDYYKAINGNSPSQRQEYNKEVCDVSVIDYKTQTLLAKVRKGDNFSPSTITVGKNGVGQESNGVTQVFKEISDYLNSFPLELIPGVRPTPGS